MNERHETPDILSSLMKGPGIKTEGNKAIKPEDKPAFSDYDHLEEPKEKATFNLPIKLLEVLEDKWMEIRKMAGSKQISKTLIVETALITAFTEFDAKKEKSKFYSCIAGNKA